MKTLDGLEVRRGDQVMAPGDSNSVVVGTVHELYDRSEELRVGGYALRIPARNAVSAVEAFKAYTALLLAKREAEAAAKNPTKPEETGTPSTST